MPEPARPLIVKTGRFESTKRGFRLRRTPLPLPDLDHGQRLILIDSSGQARPANSVTGGERAFSRFASWVVIDGSDRDLHLEYDDLFSTVNARYVIAVDAHVHVGSGAELAISGISSLDSYCRPKISATIKRALRGLEIPGEKVANAVTQVRAVGEGWLHDELVGKAVEDLPKWLIVTITDLSIGNDAAAETHTVELRRVRNEKEIIVAQAVNQLTQTKFSIKRSQLLRDALAPHMTSAAAATLEAVWQDPSPEKFDAAIASLREVEQRDQDLFVAVVGHLAESDSYVDAAGLVKVVQQVLDMRDPEVRAAIPAAEVRSELAGEPASAQPDEPVESASTGSDDTNFSD